MTLVWILLLPFFGGVLAWWAARWSQLASRWVALCALLAQLLLVLFLGTQYWAAPPVSGHAFIDFTLPWIPQIGISFHLALDGLSLLLLLLTAFLGVLSVLASWTGIHTKIGLFHFNLLWSIAGISGTFLAMDLFLFYFSWEMMLIPLYFLIEIWGHEQRHYAAVKFFLFTQAGGLFLLVGILGLVIAHGAATGSYTFDYFALLHTPLAPAVAFWLMLAFFLAFAVKLPAVPVHTWLPDAHTQAPVAGSVDLAGLVLKVGAYGLLRFAVPLFPAASFAFASVPMVLGIVGILYGALLAFGQTDFKRLVAYTSISHMGFVLLGIYAWNTLALQGVTVILLAHGLSTGALFILIGALSQRTGTREISRMSGLWACWPRLSGVGLFLVLALLGLPGLGTFIGEFLVLLGVFRVAPVFAAVAAAGFIVSMIYAVRIVQQVFWGPPLTSEPAADLGAREMAMLVPVMALLVWIGLYPQPLLRTAAPALDGLRAAAGTTYGAGKAVEVVVEGGAHDSP